MKIIKQIEQSQGRIRLVMCGGVSNNCENDVD